MAFDVSAAMARAGIPAYRSAYRLGEDEQQPDSYVIFSVDTSYTDFWDDAPHGFIYRPTLHLCTRGSPLLLLPALRAEMAGEGFACINEQDGYDKDADLYVHVTQWEGVKRDGQD